MAATNKHFQPFVMAEERAARSVFVGNIPYEATEEQLKDIFSQAGPVASFRLVYDRETGKPKGYGFCEYNDIETAQSAMRNLNNHDFNGRPLRVGVAAGEQTKEEIRLGQQSLTGPAAESPYGEPVEADKAPEAISKAVASLPPEQMFELMKQMKMCIQNNPNEARNMLLQNPQLAYALLQAQIVMKIVDPQVALAMLHRNTEQIPPVMPSGTSNEKLMQQPNSTSLTVDSRAVIGQDVGLAAVASMGPTGFSGSLSMDSGHPRLESVRQLRPAIPHVPQRLDSNAVRMGAVPVGPRHDTMMNVRPVAGMSMYKSPRLENEFGASPVIIGPEVRDPRQVAEVRRAVPNLGPGARLQSPSMNAASDVSSNQASVHDQEKAALIMQVLQLSDEQIAMLPVDQRQSILILKEQIARSAHLGDM